MTSRDFCYWLQGYFELQQNAATETHALDPKQVEVIKRHLAMVFVHEIDPSMGDNKKQEILDAIHNHKPSKKMPGFLDDGYSGGPVKFRC